MFFEFNVYKSKLFDIFFLARKHVPHDFDHPGDGIQQNSPQKHLISIPEKHLPKNDDHEGPQVDEHGCAEFPPRRHKQQSKPRASEEAERTTAKIHCALPNAFQQPHYRDRLAKTQNKTAELSRRNHFRSPQVPFHH